MGSRKRAMNQKTALLVGQVGLLFLSPTTPNLTPASTFLLPRGQPQPFLQRGQYQGLLPLQRAPYTYNQQLLSVPQALPQALYPQTYSLCNSCSCTEDLGCAFNCHKCPAVSCAACDCDTSQGCKYNCDKCETGAEVINVETAGAGGIDNGLTSIDLCPGLNSQEDLCAFGPSCVLIQVTKFPLCSAFSCSKCSFASGQPGSQVDIVSVSVETVTSSSVISGSVGSVGSSGGYFPAPSGLGPSTAASIASLPDENVWQNPDFSHGHEGLLPHLDVEPVLAENSTEVESIDQSFSLLELHEEVSSCIASGGQLCKFPFIFNNRKYKGCVITGQRYQTGDGGSFGWCSTKVDINGMHVTGPSYDPE